MQSNIKIEFHRYSAITPVEPGSPPGCYIPYTQEQANQIHPPTISHVDERYLIARR